MRIVRILCPECNRVFGIDLHTHKPSSRVRCLNCGVMKQGRTWIRLHSYKG